MAISLFFRRLQMAAYGCLICRIWIKFYGRYHNIPPAAWARWDRLYEAYRER
jgi:hypothetical protein